MTKKINRRKFMKQMAGGALLFTSPSFFCSKENAVRGKNKKMNVLMIIIDDLRPELGCYGAKHIKSPNVDKLASEGILFNRAYVQQAICAPSRASILTGCRPDTTGVDYPYTNWFKNVFLKSHPDIQTFFYRSGYYTTAYGRVHHGFKPAFSEEHFYPDKSLWVSEKHQGKGPQPPVEMMDQPDSAYVDGDITGKVIERLGTASKKREPFFMAVGYSKPHLPFVCPKKYADLYKRDDVKLSPVPDFPENSPAYSHPGERKQDNDGTWILQGGSTLHREKYYLQNPGGLTEEFQRTLIHGYYACISFIDAQIGRLIQELKNLGMWENTVVVLFSDQGYHLGDHNWWTKKTVCEFDTRVPLIFRVPGQKMTGHKTDALVEAVDIYPTLLDACGFNIPGYMEGTSFMPLIENPKREWKKAAFSQYPRGRSGARGYREAYSIRTENFRCTEWRDNEGKVRAREFYDHRKDSFESKNLINEKKYKKIIEEHEKILKEGWKKALPPGMVNKSNNPRGDDSEYLMIIKEKEGKKK